MHDRHESQEQLALEVRELRGRLAVLEASRADMKEQARALDLARQQLLSIFDSIDEPIYVADPESCELLYVNEGFKRLWGEGVGRKCHEVLQSEDAPCVFCTNDKILGENVGRTYIWEFQNQTTGRWFRCIDKAIPWPDGRLVRYEMAIDITERKQNEQLLRESHDAMEERVSRRTAELAAANAALVKEVAERKQTAEALRESEATTRAMIDAVTETAILVEADGTIVTLNETAARRLGIRVDEALGVRASRFLSPEIVAARRRYHEQVLASGKSVEYEDVRDGRCFHTSVYPIFDAEGKVARQVVFARDVTEAKKADEELRRKQRLLRQLLDLQEQERRLVAYEIHDGLAQELTGALLRLQAFREILKRDPDDAWRVFDVGVNLLGQSVSEARRLITGLRPMILDESGIAAAIDYLVCENTQRGGPRIEFHDGLGDDRLAAALEVAVFRIVQEALTNARQHSRGDRVRVDLSRRDGTVRVEVRDWGVGFDAATVTENQFGLESIRERARLLGGHATVDAAPGKGTRILVELPVVKDLPGDGS
ncbi:MAG: PAS domain S-box protein [Planctomycetia bacterium]|nr:PAS domain S-box protein [Planctomycetia bacterium]